MERADKIISEYFKELRKILYDYEHESHPGTDSTYNLRIKWLWEDYYNDGFIRARRLDNRDMFRIARTSVNRDIFRIARLSVNRDMFRIARASVNRIV